MVPARIPFPHRLALTVLLVCLAAAGTLPGPALAQDDGAGQVAAFIDRNADLLDWALDIVADTGSVPARRVLREAHDLHLRSLDLLGQDRPLLALGAARRARAALWRAVGLAREALSLEERLRLRAERFGDLQADLRETAREGGDARALELLDRAAAQADRAQEQYLQGDAKLGLQLLEQADQLLNRAARLLAEGTGPERLDRELERTAALLDRTRELLGGSAEPAVLNLLAEAEQALDRAREHRDQGQPGRALQMLGLARRLAGRAGASAQESPDPETARRQLERWDERAAAVAEKVAASGSEEARRHLERARDHRRRAQEALAADDLPRALGQIRAAHDQLGQAEGLAR